MSTGNVCLWRSRGGDGAARLFVGASRDGKEMHLKALQAEMSEIKSSAQQRITEQTNSRDVQMQS